MALSSAILSLFPGSTRAEQPAPHSTPIGNSGAGFTLVEKQAVIDDLQLEISKRARGLRTIYSEQARQLRESLERRIHRIPPRMRNKTMGELVDEQAKKATAMKTATPKAQPSARPPKRTSDAAFGSGNKENAQPPGGYPDLDFQKKRAKTTHTQSPAKTTVLSPRSHNSRIYASKIASPEKPAAKSRATTAIAKARPVSRATSRQGTATRKPAAKKAIDSEINCRDSDGSSSSARTMIVKPAAKRAAPAKKPVVKTTTTTKKRAPTKTETALPTTTRTLRKRG